MHRDLGCDEPELTEPLPNLLFDRASLFTRLVLGGEALPRESAGGVSVLCLCWREREVHVRFLSWTWLSAS